MVEDEGRGGVEDVDRGGTSLDGKDVSVCGTVGEVTVVVTEEVIFSDEEEKGVELGSGGVSAWAGFDSSHWPFLQQGDSRKSNRQEETLSTTQYCYCYRARLMLISATRRETFCSLRANTAAPDSWSEDTHCGYNM